MPGLSPADFVPPATLPVGPFRIYLYSVFVLIGIAAGYYLAKPAARRAGINTELLQLSIFYGVIPGVVGARLYHVIDQWPRYAAHPAEIVAIWHGGLGIIGGLAAGTVGLYVFARRYKVNFLRLLDVWAPAALLGQAIGRFGNWTNQEAFGPPTDLPWKIYIDPEHRPDQYVTDKYFHPTYFYEAGWDLLGLVLVLVMRRRFAFRPGTTLGIYLVVYGTGRFIAEFFRFDTAQTFGLPTAQILAVVLVGAGVYLLRKRAAPLGRRWRTSHR